MLQGIVSAVNTQIAQSYTNLTSSLAQTYLSTATGSSLDFIGDMLGLPRGGYSTGQQVNAQQFYVLTGTFGNLPGIGALNNVIPAGTILSTSDGSIQYQTVGPTPFTNSSTSVSATIQALNPGSSSNIGVNVLTTSNLNVAGLLTTNSIAITNGDDTQTDTDYRYALSQAVTAAEAGNLVSIQLAALSVPGVSSIMIIPYYYGVGTYAIIVIGIVPPTSQDVLNNVLQTVQQVTSLGELVTVITPRYVGVDLTATLIFTPTTPANTKTAIAQQVVNNLYNYINNIPLGQGLIRDQIINQILNTSTQIQDVDNDPTSSTYMQIGLWTPTTVEIVNGITITNRVRQSLPENYTAFFDDEMIIEMNLQGFTHDPSFVAVNINY